MLGDSRHLRAGDHHALPASVLPQMAGCGRQRGGSSRRGNHILDFCRHHARGDAVRLAGHEPVQPFEFALARRIVAKEFIGEADRAQRQTHHVANMAPPGDGQLATSASQIHHQRRCTVYAEIGDESQMNQTRFFQSGNNLNLPSGGGTHPLQKRLRIAGIPQCAGRDDPDWVRDHLLCGAMKAPQNLHRFRHRLGGEKAGTKHALAQARNLAVFVDGTKAATCEACDLQPDRIGTDINRGKGWHVARPTVYMPIVTRSSGRRRWRRSTSWRSRAQLALTVPVPRTEGHRVGHKPPL